MKGYHSFFGIDIAKEEFVVACHGQRRIKTYMNNLHGINEFIKDHSCLLKHSLVVLETTGGYEWEVIVRLTKRNIAVHRADTVMVKNFIRSMRRYGKTDTIDAHGLAAYAFERHAKLKLFQEPDKKQLRLQLLVRRRDEIVQMRTQETNRSQSPMYSSFGKSFKMILTAHDKAIKAIEKEMQQLIESDQAFQHKKDIMLALPGIGEKTAHKLLALMPELGHITRRSVAHLAGVAPHPHDSGKIHGYRKTRGGRQDVKKTLFMAAMAASRSKGRLGDFYRDLVERGKKKMVALIALMRKIIIIINAQIRDFMIEKKTISGPVVGRI